MRILEEETEFQWDAGNMKKSEKHKVKDTEAEEVFFDEHKFIFKDIIHSQNEKRFRILGKTKKGRLLFIVFTRRKNKLRIISARDINK